MSTPESPRSPFLAVLAVALLGCAEVAFPRPSSNDGGDARSDARPDTIAEDAFGAHRADTAVTVDAVVSDSVAPSDATAVPVVPDVPTWPFDPDLPGDAAAPVDAGWRADAVLDADAASPMDAMISVDAGSTRDASMDGCALHLGEHRLSVDFWIDPSSTWRTTVDHRVRGPSASEVDCDETHGPHALHVGSDVYRCTFDPAVWLRPSWLLCGNTGWFTPAFGSLAADHPGVLHTVGDRHWDNPLLPTDCVAIHDTWTRAYLDGREVTITPAEVPGLPRTCRFAITF